MRRFLTRALLMVAAVALLAVLFIEPGWAVPFRVDRLTTL